MENIAPLYKACVQVRLGLESGESISIVTKQVIEDSVEPLKSQLEQFWVCQSRNEKVPDCMLEKMSFQRSCFFSLLQRAFSGEPILDALLELEKDAKNQCDIEVESFLANLPFKALLPLLLFQLPAYLVLFFGPALSEFLKGIQ